MDAFPILWIVAVMLAIIAFDAVAMLFGSDSREPMLDDHQR